MVDEQFAVASFGSTGTANPNFVGGNVNNQYNGDPMGTLESITTIRDEATLKWTHVGDTTTFQTTLAYADAGQDSMYEGTDYVNDDKTYFADFKVVQMLNDEHLLTYGIDFKSEIMKAKSTGFAPTPTANGKDDFDYYAYGIYLQDTWTMTHDTELNVALRGCQDTYELYGAIFKRKRN